MAVGAFGLCPIAKRMSAEVCLCQSSIRHRPRARGLMSTPSDESKTKSCFARFRARYPVTRQARQVSDAVCRLPLLAGPGSRAQPAQHSLLRARLLLEGCGCERAPPPSLFWQPWPILCPPVQARPADTIPPRDVDQERHALLSQAPSFRNRPQYSHTIAVTHRQPAMSTTSTTADETEPLRPLRFAAPWKTPAACTATMLSHHEHCAWREARKEGERRHYCRQACSIVPPYHPAIHI